MLTFRCSRSQMCKAVHSRLQPLTNFAKFTKNTCARVSFLIYQKKVFRHICFLVNSAQFLITRVLKIPPDGCYCINTHSVWCPSTTFCDVTHHREFSRLNLKTGTRVSSIFPILIQRLIFNPVKHLPWSISSKEASL